MGYGYSLLPTVDEPVSNMTFRLTPSEKRERDEWILGAVEHEMNITDIAYEVGLSEQRVKQIIKQNTPQINKSSVAVGSKRKFKTPRDAAMDEFYREGLCRYCKKEGYPDCPTCIGEMGLVECCYDKDGMPYSWALDESQIKYLQQAGIPTSEDIITLGVTDTCHDIGFRDGGIGWGHTHSLCSKNCECFPDCQSKNFMVFSQGPKNRPGEKTYLI